MQKIINDPIYGFIHIDHPLIVQLIDHPYVQRLRRISQMGLSSLVYPSATHSRFSHSLGAFYLMQQAIKTLRQKKNSITKEEERAALIAILLHDIGHSPFSHSLEKKLLPFSHEELSLHYIQLLNQQFKRKLDLAERIFFNQYKKQFLCQLVNSQIDVDRLDYLARDSFYTGVIEGKVGYDRILGMIDVHKQHLAIDPKGVTSVEHFLFARHFMYEQVYYHRVSFAIECILAKTIQRAIWVIKRNPTTHGLGDSNFIKLISLERKKTDIATYLELFSRIDDHDVWLQLKAGCTHNDIVYATLCNAIVYRKLFSVEQQDKAFSKQTVNSVYQHIKKRFPSLSEHDISFLCFTASSSTDLYKKYKYPIWVKQKDGSAATIDQLAQNFPRRKPMHPKPKHYLCYFN